MRGEQRPTSSETSRWLKALKSRPTRVSGESAIGTSAKAADQSCRDGTARRAGDREDRHVVIERVRGEGAQGALEALHRPGRVARAGKLGPQPLLAEAPVLALGLDDAIGDHHQLLAGL